MTLFPNLIDVSTKSPPIGKNGLFRSARGKFSILALGTLLMLFGVAPSAWAEEYAVTIYFGGTGLTENGWTVGDTQTGHGNTRWDTPNLIAALHHYQITSPTQHKLFIAGVGAPETSSGVPPHHCAGNPKTNILSDASLQQAMAHRPICRNWHYTVTEARTKLSELLLGIDPQNGDTVTWNVIGHSRGAIAAMWYFGEQMYDTGHLDGLIKTGVLLQLNLIVLDPVPGVGILLHDFRDVEDKPKGNPMGWDIFRLNEPLDKVVAIYAEDERSNRFGAVVPRIGDAIDRLTFSVLGPHQTMVGNLWKGGHAPQKFPAVCPYPYTDLKHHAPLSFHIPLCAGAVHNVELKAVRNVVAITIIELLSGPAWGNVKFTNDEHFLDDIYAPGGWDDDESVRKTTFDTQITDMRSINDRFMQLMRITSFFPGPLWPYGIIPPVLVPPIPLEEFRVGRGCQSPSFSYQGVFKPWLLKNDEPRCVVYVMMPENSTVDYLIGPLISELIPAIGSSDLSSDKAWKRIGEMRVSDDDDDDDDDDGVVNNDDVCPATVIPESVPTVGLKPNHWALVDDNLEFDTVSKGVGPDRSYGTTDTMGCSCEQIIEAQGLGKGHTKFGCSIGAMDAWVRLVNP